MASTFMLFLCAALSSDDSNSVLDLPDMVVKPSSMPDVSAFELSPSLAQDKIQLDPTVFHIDRSLPELMQAFPGVHIQKTGHGQGSPFMRGFTGQRTVLLVDGIRFDDTVFREGPVQYWNTLDPESFAEVLFSPGLRSASAGSGAIGGVVELISSRPDPSLLWSGSVRGRLASAERSSGGRLQLSGGDGRSRPRIQDQEGHPIPNPEPSTPASHLRESAEYQLDLDWRVDLGDQTTEHDPQRAIGRHAGTNGPLTSSRRGPFD